MACYFIARITIHDPGRYQLYLAGTSELLDKYAAEVLAVDESPIRLEGQWPGTRTVLIRFPDEATAQAWYGSPEYRELAQHRFDAATADVVLLKGRELPDA